MARTPKFEVFPSKRIKEDAKSIPVQLRDPISEAIRRLGFEGCKAAGYALSGPPPWTHLCCVHVQGWRIITAFPAPGQVLLVKISPHDKSNDPYAELADQLGIETFDGPRLKPSCCEATDAAPLSPEDLALTLEASTALMPPED